MLIRACEEADSMEGQGTSHLLLREAMRTSLVLIAWKRCGQWYSSLWQVNRCLEEVLKRASEWKATLVDNLITHSDCTSIFKYVLWWTMLDCVMWKLGLALPCCLFRPQLSVKRNPYMDLGHYFDVTQVAMKSRVVCKRYWSTCKGPRLVWASFFFFLLQFC